MLGPRANLTTPRADLAIPYAAPSVQKVKEVTTPMPPKKPAKAASVARRVSLVTSETDEVVLPPGPGKGVGSGCGIGSRTRFDLCATSWLR